MLGAGRIAGASSGRLGGVRLFVGVWPPAEVVERLAALDRPSVRGLRWTTPEQWHVTLGFLGEVPDEEMEVVAGALAGIAEQLPARLEAVAGPVTTILGRTVLCLPVSGLDRAAVAVRASPLGRYPGVREPAFRGHLTLARARRGGQVPAEVRGVPLAARWPVTTLCLVSSLLEPQGARYDTVATATIR